MKKILRRIITKIVTAGSSELIENQQNMIKILKENNTRFSDLDEKYDENQKIISKLNHNYANLRSTIWELIPEHTHISGKFFPYKSCEPFYHIDRELKNIENYADPIALPIPPKHLWEGYAESEEGFLETGRVHVANMLEILAQDGFQIQKNIRVMELGCAAARMLRWLADKAVNGEFWGVDICAEHIIWCQQNLAPPFNFFTTTTEPHLPFPDNYFDFIYAGSVFSHISELADFWFLELRRILKTGGRLYVTIHDRNTINRLFETNPTFFLSEELSKVDKETNILSLPFEMFTFAMFSRDDKRNPKGAMVFYDMEYLKKKLRVMYSIKSVNLEAYGLQTGVLLEK
jgi:ubiquinone/menaquinone biosynthesis C-methylase UbiE